MDPKKISDEPSVSVETALTATESPAKASLQKAFEAARQLRICYKDFRKEQRLVTSTPDQPSLQIPGIGTVTILDQNSPRESIFLELENESESIIVELFEDGTLVTTLPESEQVRERIEQIWHKNPSVGFIFDEQSRESRRATVEIPRDAAQQLMDGLQKELRLQTLEEREKRLEVIFQSAQRIVDLRLEKYEYDWPEGEGEFEFKLNVEGLGELLVEVLPGSPVRFYQTERVILSVYEGEDFVALQPSWISLNILKALEALTKEIEAPKV